MRTQTVRTYIEPSIVEDENSIELTLKIRVSKRSGMVRVSGYRCGLVEDTRRAPHPRDWAWLTVVMVTTQAIGILAERYRNAAPAAEAA